MREDRVGIIASVAVHAGVIPLVVATALVLAAGPVKVVEVDLSLVHERPARAPVVQASGKDRAGPACRPLVKRARVRAAGRTPRPGSGGRGNREAVPVEEQAGSPPAPTLVTASDPSGETAVPGVGATYADPPGSSGSLQSRGGGGGVRGDGGGRAGDGDGRGEDGLAEGTRDYEYIRAAVMKNAAYPEEAMRRGIEGKVLLSFVVLESGRTDRIRVAASSGHRVLDEAARQAVAMTRVDRRVPYRVAVRLPIAFRLTGGKG